MGLSSLTGGGTGPPLRACSLSHWTTREVSLFYNFQFKIGQLSSMKLHTGKVNLWQPTPVLLPGDSHGWRSLVGCSPWGREESDMTERLHFDFSLSCIGEGNGNPLQCSCLENPRDWGPGGRQSMGSHRVGHD